jgi:hypothetical protein
VLSILLRRRLLQKQVDHCSERIELGGAGATNVIPKLTDGKSWSDRESGIRPKCRVAGVPERIAMEEWQARKQHIFDDVLKVLHEMPTDGVGLCVRTDDAF